MARYMTWNIEWFTQLFDPDGLPLADDEPDADRPPQTRLDRLSAIADVMRTLDPAFIGMVEGPDSTNANPTRSVDAVLAFCERFDLPYNEATIGYRSRGRQEIVALWDNTRIDGRLNPGGGQGLSPAFDSTFLVDTDDDSVEERFSFYRPPLEIDLTDLRSGTAVSVMVCHNKSKGIFNATDLVHWERENQRNRRLLLGQAEWIRRRVDERLSQGSNVMVMGDFNDGVGQDFHEVRMGRSSVEAIIGDLFEPKGLLRHFPGRPRWNRGTGAWEPSSTSFRDRITEYWVRVLIDFILVSEGLEPEPAVEEPYFVWNPYSDPRPTAEINDQLRRASDHFPVTVDLA